MYSTLLKHIPALVTSPPCDPPVPKELVFLLQRHKPQLFSFMKLKKVWLNRCHGIGLATFPPFRNPKHCHFQIFIRKQSKTSLTASKNQGFCKIVRDGAPAKKERETLLDVRVATRPGDECPATTEMKCRPSVQQLPERRGDLEPSSIRRSSGEHEKRTSIWMSFQTVDKVSNISMFGLFSLQKT